MAAVTNQHTELATGLHSRQNGQWKESREPVTRIAGGAAAPQDLHKVPLPRALPSAGAVDLDLPDERRLRGYVLGLQ